MRSLPSGMPVRPGQNFAWAEFEVTSTGLPNSLPAWAYPRILQLVEMVLQPLRDRLGRPVRITSGFRSEVVNRAIHGSKHSQHKRGEAADIDVDDMSAEDLATAIVELGVPYHQLIWYDPELGGHVHVGLRYAAPGTTMQQGGQSLHAYVGPKGEKKYRAWRPAGERRLS